MALGALGEHRHPGDDVRARLEVPQLLTRAAAALVPRPHAVHPTVVDQQLGRRGLREEIRPAGLGLLGEEAPELRHGDRVVAVVPHRGRGRDADVHPAGEQEHRLAVDLAVVRHVAHRQPVAEQPPQRAGIDDGPGQQVRAGGLALLDQRDRNVAQPLGGLGGVLQQLPEPDRARQPGGAAADDQDADLDALVGRIGRRRDRFGRRERRRVVERPRHLYPVRARTSSASFGTIWCRSPTTPRSANSKIGAFGSLLMATIVPEPCMPTLCWIAPEIPHAMYSFGETVLPVCPTCAAYGYHPESTTARVAATAPPSTSASSSQYEKPSGLPSPRPPATITSASSIDGPLAFSVRCSTSLARVEKSWNSVETSFTSAEPPDSTGSNVPARTSASRGVELQPTSTSTESPSAGRTPTSSPPSARRSVRSQLRPASRRAASPAATSAASTEAANRTVSAPESRTTASSASTRGCGSGVASASSSPTYTVDAPKAPAAAAAAPTPLPRPNP